MRKICVLLILGLLASVAHASDIPYTWEYNMSTDPVGDGWFVRTPGSTGQYNMTDSVGMMHMTGLVTLDTVQKHGFWLDTVSKYTFRAEAGAASGPAPWLDIESNRGTGLVGPIVRSICWQRVYRDTPTTQAVHIGTGVVDYVTPTLTNLDVNGFGLGMIDASTTYHVYTGAQIHGIDAQSGRGVSGKFDYVITDGTVTKSALDVNYVSHTAGTAPNYPTIWSGNWGTCLGYLDYYYLQTGPPIPPEEIGISITSSPGLSGHHVTVSYDASASAKPVRGFALDVSLSGATFTSNPTNYSSDYPLAPGSMIISGGSITNNGNHLTSGGSGTSAATIEMASLTGTPASTGTLFEFDVSGDCTVAIAENVLAGGITLEDHTLNINLTVTGGSVVDTSCTSYLHHGLDGDAGSGLGPPNFGMPDGKVDTLDLNMVINVNNWGLNTTDIGGTADRCADLGSGLGPPNFGARDGKVDTMDLNIVINVNNWGCPTAVGCTWP